MRFLREFILALLVVSVLSKARRHQKHYRSRNHVKKSYVIDSGTLKRHDIGSAGDPYEGIGPITPLTGSSFQSGIEDGSLVEARPATPVSGTNRYYIPDSYGYTHHGYNHYDNYAAPRSYYHSDSYLYPHHHIPYHWHDVHCGGYSDCADYGAYTHHTYPHYHHAVDYSHYHYTEPYAHSHYELEGYPGVIGSVLSNSQALKLGFDSSYLKKLGFDGSKWRHGYGYGFGRGGRGGRGGIGSGCRAPLDVAFLIDGSTEKDKFLKFMTYAKAVVKRLEVSESRDRVGVVTFADVGDMKFGFDKYLKNSDVTKALDNLAEKFVKKDGRKLGAGLTVAKTELFDVTGRDEKHKILIVITDNAAGDSFNDQVTAIKNMGVSIYVIGPKADINVAQANQIASAKNEWFVHLTDDYDAMAKKASVVPKINCTVDVVFIVDCTKGGETELKTIKSFIKRSISNLQISTAGDHVAIVTYGGTAETKFHLKKKTSPSSLASAIEDLECGNGGASDGAVALAQARDVFDKSGREDSIHVAVYLAGGAPGSDLVDPAKALKNYGVRLYAVGYTKEATEDSLKRFASTPSDFYVHDRDDVKKLETAVGRTLINHFRELKGNNNGFGGRGGSSWYGGYGRQTIASSKGEKSDSDGISSSLRRRLEGLSRRNLFSDDDDLDINLEEDLLNDDKDQKAGQRQKIERSFASPALDADDVTIGSESADDDYDVKGDEEISHLGERRTFSSEDKEKDESVAVEGDKGKDASAGEGAEKPKTESSSNIEDKTDKSSDAKENKQAANGDDSNKSTSDAAAEKTGTASSTNNEQGSSGKIDQPSKGQSNITTRAKSSDPYLSIGTDVSSEESAMNLKPRVSESNSGATSQKKADVTSKDTAIKATEHASDVHTDIVESNSAISTTDVNAKKRRLDKKSEAVLKMPVNSLVSSILKTAAHHAVKTFTQGSMLKDVAKSLVKAAVHNALASRPRFVKAFKEHAKKAKKSKKKRNHNEARSKVDLMEVAKGTKEQSKQPSVAAMEPPALKKSVTDKVSGPLINDKV